MQWSINYIDRIDRPGTFFCAIIKRDGYTRQRNPRFSFPPPRRMMAGTRQVRKRSTRQVYTRGGPEIALLDQES